MTEKNYSADSDSHMYPLNEKYSPAIRLAAWENWKELCSVGNLHPESEAMRQKIRKGEISQADAEAGFAFMSSKIDSFFSDGLKLSEKKSGGGKKQQEGKESFIPDWQWQEIKRDFATVVPKGSSSDATSACHPADKKAYTSHFYPAVDMGFMNFRQ